MEDFCNTAQHNASMLMHFKGYTLFLKALFAAFPTPWLYNQAPSVNETHQKETQLGGASVFVLVKKKI